MLLCDDDASAKFSLDELNINRLDIANGVVGKGTSGQVKIGTGNRGPILFASFENIVGAVSGDLVATEALSIDEKNPFKFAILIGKPIHEAAAVKNIKRRQGIDLNYRSWVVRRQGEGREENLPFRDILQQEAI